MNYLFFIFCLLPFYCFSAINSFQLSNIEVECSVSDYCAARKQRYLNLTGDYRSLVHLKETLRIMASDGGYESLSYDVIKMDETYKLLIKMKLKPTIKEINIGTIDRNMNMDPSLLLTIKEGDFFETQRLS